MELTADCKVYSKVADRDMERAIDKDPDWNKNVEDAIWERHFQSEVDDDSDSDDDKDDVDSSKDNNIEIETSTVKKTEKQAGSW